MQFQILYHPVNLIKQIIRQLIKCNKYAPQAKRKRKQKRHGPSPIKSLDVKAISMITTTVIQLHYFHKNLKKTTPKMTPKTACATGVRLGAEEDFELLGGSAVSPMITGLMEYVETDGADVIRISFPSVGWRVKPGVVCVGKGSVTVMVSVTAGRFEASISRIDKVAHNSNQYKLRCKPQSRPSIRGW